MVRLASRGGAIWVRFTMQAPGLAAEPGGGVVPGGRPRLA
jgi:hypothetical protein